MERLDAPMRLAGENDSLICCAAMPVRCIGIFRDSQTMTEFTWRLVCPNDLARACVYLIVERRAHDMSRRETRLTPIGW